MLTNISGLTEILDSDLVGFLTAVNDEGRPQTSAVWFVRDGDDIVVFNKASSPRLESIAANPWVAFNLRGDRRAKGTVTMEGTAVVEAGLSPARDFPGYLEKYAREIELLGWTPDSFSADYSTGLRITVTRVRSFGLKHLSD